MYGVEGLIFRVGRGDWGGDGGGDGESVGMSGNGLVWNVFRVGDFCEWRGLPVGGEQEGVGLRVPRRCGWEG